jgi:hypothetical protein
MGSYGDDAHFERLKSRLIRNDGNIFINKVYVIIYPSPNWKVQRQKLLVGQDLKK